MSYFARVLAALCIAALMITSGRAAVFDYKLVDGLNAIYISGEIVDGDTERLGQITLSISGPTVVVLNSKGGQVVEGIRIGETIRSAGYATAVMNDSVCASACGLIWLAGRPRYVGRSANIGFHAAYVGSGDDVRESGVGNAIVGAYLTKLGLSYDAVLFATSAGPNEIQWLRPEDAQRIGIECITLSDPEPEQPRRAPPARAAQVLPDGSPLEQRVMKVVLSYYAFWSRSGTDVDGLSRYYGDTVTFYGSSVARSKVIDEKRKFSARWPTRHYAVKISTLFVQCADTCSVTGVVEWDVGSSDRGAHSVGAANIMLRIVPADSEIGGVIVSESGSVLSNHTDSLASVPQASVPTPLPFASNAAVPPEGSGPLPAEQQVASTTTAYAEGRQARVDYERWFASVPEGQYRDGVVFWARNRSLKVPPSCAQSGGTREWHLGCADAHARFAIVDPRRNAERNYWWGWNSL